ncbi:MAG: M48 family metallopeptidase [Candidatus Nanohaloarchaea archaeon]
MKVNSDKEIEVKSPIDLDKEDIEETLKEKKPWILEKINRIEEETWPPKNKEFLSGEKLLYKGRRYLMKVRSGENTEVNFTGEKFIIKSSNYENDSKRRKEVARSVKEWYQQKASEKLVDRTYKLSEEIGQEPEEVNIVDYENKWGENKSGEIKLHWRLVLAPQEIQDYVIAHELCHLKRQDHSDMFWNTLRSIIPDYERRREWLRTNGQKLAI